MATEKLEIQVSADVQKAVAGIDKLNKSISQTSKELPNLNKATGQANTALTNFGRVVQDAPFGILGIANNIDPLLTSFQNLKRETGSTGAAFKSLLSSLAGPAGIAIGISAVTSVLIAFGPEIANAASGVSKFDEGLRGALTEGAEAAKKAQLEFTKYSNIINDSTVSADRQNAALKEINNSLRDYGLQINSVADFQKNSAQISALFVMLKQEEAKAQVLAAKAAEEYGKQIAAQFTIQKAQGVLSDRGAGQSLLVDAFNDLVAAIQEYSSSNTLGKAIELERAFTDQVNQSNTNIASLIQQIKNVSGVTETFGNKTKDATLTIKNQVEQIRILAAEAAKVRAEVNAFNADPTIKLAPKPQQGININRADRTSSLVITPEALKKQLEYQAQLDAINEKLAAQRELVATISGTIENGIGAGIDQFFNALANNQDPFEALQQSVKRLVVELAAAVVKMLVLKALSAAITGGGSLGAGALVGGGGGGGALDFLLRGDLLSGAIGRNATRRRNFP